MYLKATEKADAIHDADSRAKAFAAIEKIYAKRAGLRKAYLDARNLSDDPTVRDQTSQALGEVTKAQEKKSEDERTLAETKQKNYEDSEQLVKNGDYISAQMFYMRAISI